MFVYNINNKMFECQFCEKQLSTKSSLNMHQSKTKYCLEKQNNNKKVSLLCDYCNSSFTYLNNLKKHRENCKEKRIKEIEENNEKLVITINNNHKKEIDMLKEEHKKEIYKLKDEYNEKEKNLIIKYENEKIELLKEEIKNAKPSSIINTNNYTNSNNGNGIGNKYTHLNNLDLSEDKVKKATEFYTIEHYDNGVDGLADWCVKYVLTDSNGKIHYICTDKTRRNFVYRDMNGVIVNDSQAQKLKNIIRPLLDLKFKEYKKIKYMELAEIDDDDNELTENISKLHNENKEIGISFEKGLVDKIYT